MNSPRKRQAFESVLTCGITGCSFCELCTISTALVVVSKVLEQVRLFVEFYSRWNIWVVRVCFLEWQLMGLALILTFF